MIQQAPFRDRWNISLATSNKSESPEERQGACHNSEDPHPLHELSLKVAKILTDKTPWYQDQICFHLASRTVEPEGFHQATISQNAVVSPAEFHLLLINEQAKLHTLLHLLQELYSDETHSLSEDLIQPQVSCVARMADNTWQRALIQHVGNDEVSLMFVDFGITQFCPFRDVKPLWIEFGKLHPFALHSTLFRKFQMKSNPVRDLCLLYSLIRLTLGLEKTELWLVKIQQFKDILEELHYTVVVQFVRRSVGSGMYEVSLFNSGLEDMFKRKFCYIRRGREQWDYSYVVRRHISATLMK